MDHTPVEEHTSKIWMAQMGLDDFKRERATTWVHRRWEVDLGEGGGECDQIKSVKFLNVY